MESVEISLVSNGSDADELSSDVSFADLLLHTRVKNFIVMMELIPPMLMNMVHPHLKKHLMMKMSLYTVRN
jgi:hypothetical protein